MKAIDQRKLAVGAEVVIEVAQWTSPLAALLIGNNQVLALQTGDAIHRPTENLLLQRAVVNCAAFIIAEWAFVPHAAFAHRFAALATCNRLFYDSKADGAFRRTVADEQAGWVAIHGSC